MPTMFITWSLLWRLVIWYWRHTSSTYGVWNLNIANEYKGSLPKLCFMFVYHKKESLLLHFTKDNSSSFQFHPNFLVVKTCAPCSIISRSGWSLVNALKGSKLSNKKSDNLARVIRLPICLSKLPSSSSSPFPKSKSKIF